MTDPLASEPAVQTRAAVQERRQLESREFLLALQGLLEVPMVVLSFVFLVLLIVEFTVPLSPVESRRIWLASWLIWLAFLVEFGLKFYLAPQKGPFLRENWLLALSLLVPSLRLFRLVRAVRALRAVNALRVIARTNRSLQKLAILLAGQKLAYLALTVLLVTLASGAGIYVLERGAPDATIRGFGDALWYAAATVTAVGAGLGPVTGEGRVLAVLTMVFGLSVIGYVAGTLASLCIRVGQLEERETREAERQAPALLLEELRRLRERVEALQDAGAQVAGVEAPPEEAGRAA